MKEKIKGCNEYIKETIPRCSFSECKGNYEYYKIKSQNKKV